MPPLKDHAIVLRHLDYSETSQVLACLTRLHGPRRLIAKGIKRSTKKGKPSSTIDLLEHGEMIFLVRPQHAEALAILTEWRQVDAHLGLRDDLSAWYAGQYAAEITAAMTEEADPHPELFDALAALLTTLAAGGSTRATTERSTGPASAEASESPVRASDVQLASSSTLPSLVAYQCALLIATGWWPDLNRCVICDRPAPPGRAGYYSAVQGGLVCRQCEPQVAAKRYISAAGLDALRSRQFEAACAKQVFVALDETIGVAVGRPTSLGPQIVTS